MTVQHSITLTRSAGDEETQSFDVWANPLRIPQGDGDGTFVANVPIGGGQASVVYTWTPPTDALRWSFLAIPIRHDVRGIAGGIGR